MTWELNVSDEIISKCLLDYNLSELVSHHMWARIVSTGYLEGCHRNRISLIIESHLSAMRCEWRNSLHICWLVNDEETDSPALNSCHWSEESEIRFRWIMSQCLQSWSTSNIQLEHGTQSVCCLWTITFFKMRVHVIALFWCVLTFICSLKCVWCVIPETGWGLWKPGHDAQTDIKEKEKKEKSCGEFVTVSRNNTAKDPSCEGYKTSVRVLLCTLPSVIDISDRITHTSQTLKLKQTAAG